MEPSGLGRNVPPIAVLNDQSHGASLSSGQKVLDLLVAHCVVMNAVDVIADLIRVPFGRICMERIVKISQIAVVGYLKFFVNEEMRERRVGAIVKRTASQHRLIAAVFHNVDFTLTGPWRIGQQPNCRPHSIGRW